MSEVAGDIMVSDPKTLGADADVKAVRSVFLDDHVHLVLVVDIVGRLLTTIERADVSSDLPGLMAARDLGQLDGRVTSLNASIDLLTAELDRAGRRRMAVVDESGRLAGLVCRKRNRSGYCTESGIRARARASAAGCP